MDHFVNDRDSGCEVRSLEACGRILLKERFIVNTLVEVVATNNRSVECLRTRRVQRCL